MNDERCLPFEVAPTTPWCFCDGLSCLGCNTLHNGQRCAAIHHGTRRISGWEYYIRKDSPHSDRWVCCLCPECCNRGLDKKYAPIIYTRLITTDDHITETAIVVEKAGGICGLIFFLLFFAAMIKGCVFPSTRAHKNAYQNEREFLDDQDYHRGARLR